MIQPQFTCPNCGSGRSSVTLRHEGWSLVECECGAEMLWPIPDLTGEYSEDNCFSDQGGEIAEQWLHDPSPWRADAASLQRDLRCNGIADGERLIDVGCSYGLGPIEWARLGYEAWGIEPSEKATDFIRQNGANAWKGTILDPDMPIPSGAGLIFSSHALEHMPDPYAALRRFWDLLRPGGLLILALPHWGSAEAQTKRQDWRWWAPPWHIHYFRHDRFSRHLANIGFEIMSVNTAVEDHEISGVTDAERTRNRTALKANLGGETVIIWARKPA